MLEIDYIIHTNRVEYGIRVMDKLEHSYMTGIQRTEENCQSKSKNSLEVQVHCHPWLVQYVISLLRTVHGMKSS